MPITSTQSLLKKHDIRPKKQLGQHFLSAIPTVKKIVASADIRKTDTVVEIGPGPGIMTGYISEAAKKVVAIDMDVDILAVAKKELSAHRNITWVRNNILKVDLKKLVRKKAIVLGNLPYNISSQIIFWMIDNRKNISKANIMLQKEVAVRICAKPGGKDYGIISVIAQAFAKCQKLFDVSAKSFIPPPKVTSSVITLNFEDTDYKIDDEENFKKIVKAAFGQRRKTLRNSLVGASNVKLKPEDVDSALLDSLKQDVRFRAKVDYHVRFWQTFIQKTEDRVV